MTVDSFHSRARWLEAYFHLINIRIWCHLLEEKLVSDTLIHTIGLSSSRFVMCVWPLTFAVEEAAVANEDVPSISAA